MEWEAIDAWNMRTRVFGGWIVKSFDDTDKYLPAPTGNPNWTVSMTFVPDVYGIWDINRNPMENEK